MHTTRSLEIIAYATGTVPTPLTPLLLYPSPFTRQRFFPRTRFPAPIHFLPPPPRTNIPPPPMISPPPPYPVLSPFPTLLSTGKSSALSPPPPPPPPGSAWVAVPCPPPPPQMGCHTNHALPRKLQRQAREFISKCGFCHNKNIFFSLFLLQLSSSDGSGAGTSHASSFSML